MLVSRASTTPYSLFLLAAARRGGASAAVYQFAWAAVAKDYRRVAENHRNLSLPVWGLKV